MSEKAFESLAAALTNPLSRNPQGPGENVVPLNLTGQAAPANPPAQAPAKRLDPPSSSHPDWSSTVQLIHEAHEAMRISDERVEELEAYLNDVIAQAQDEVSHLTKRAEAAERRAAAAERQAQEAEARAQDAENWLMHLHEVVVRSFGPILKNQPAAANASPRPSPPPAKAPLLRKTFSAMGSGTSERRSDYNPPVK